MRVHKLFTRRPRTRFNKDSIQPFLAVAPTLRQLMVRYRARGGEGRHCRLDKGAKLLGPGIRFQNGSILTLPNPCARNWPVRRRAPLPQKAAWPFLILWQDKFLKLLSPRARRKGKASGRLRKEKPAANATGR